MRDRRLSRVRSALRAIGRAMTDGLAALGACTCGGAAAAARTGQGDLDDHGDAEVRDQAARGIAEIEAHLAAVDPPGRGTDDRARRRRRDAP